MYRTGFLTPKRIIVAYDNDMSSVLYAVFIFNRLRNPLKYHHRYYLDFTSEGMKASRDSIAYFPGPHG